MKKDFSIIPSFLFGDFAGEYDCGDGAVMNLYNSVSKDEYDAYCNTLTENGFNVLQRNKIDFYHCVTFKKAEKSVAISYSEPDATMRLIIDSHAAVLNTETGGKGKCPVRLWQFEIDHSLIDCGMCYIIQCSDYSFFIIDSAHFYSLNDDLRIYAFLRVNTPENMPVRVCGWFFSHGHIDHIGKFIDILKYNTDVAIEGLYYNFVPLNHFSASSWAESDKRHAERFLSEVKKHNIPVYKLHSGQYFCLDCLRFDVLCTHEDVFPHSLENYNDSSTVLIMRVKDDKVCFPGDAGAEESKILEDRFPEFLSSDIVQVSHHGHFGVSKEFYRAVSADVTLYPTTQIKFDEDYPRYEANRIACAKAKYTFIASNGTVGFTFPLKGSEIVVYPDETFENFDGIYNLWGYKYSQEYKNSLKKKFKENNSTKKYMYIQSKNN